MIYSIKNFNGTIPVLCEEYKESELKSDGSRLLDNQIVIVNPLNFNLLKNVLYVYTLLPFREDMISTTNFLTKKVGLNAHSDKTKVASGFEMRSLEDALDFFIVKSGNVNPMIKDWVYSLKGSKIFEKFFKSEQISDFASAPDHPVVKLLNKLKE